jgi:hypothetical protein
MKKIFYSFSISVLLCSKICLAQTDTIFSNNEKTACNVKEVTQDAVKFTYPNEDLVNIVYKNTIQKIVFKSGRVQTFAESTSFKKIESSNDYENVTISQVESEIKGLYKIGDVSAKAKGTTVYSNQEKVKQRAYKKLKIEAAMMGANIVYLTAQRTEGNKYGGYYQSGSSAETNLTGIAYSNILPSYSDFEKLMLNKTIFFAILDSHLWYSGTDISQIEISKKFEINSIKNENGLIIINGVLEGELNCKVFRVVSFNSESFNIFYQDKNMVYNIKIKI